MTGDELIREIELKKHLSELDGSSVSDYDSSESMTEEELRSDNRFLIEQLSHILYNFSIPLKIRGVLKEEAILPQHFHNNFNLCEAGGKKNYRRAS